MTESPDKKDLLLQRWRRGELAEHSIVVTAALAVVLAVCLLAAGIIVVSRSVQSRAVARQEMAAAAVLSEVARRGLSYYLPETPMRMYYLIKEGDDVVGYAGSYLGKVTGDDGAITFKGEQVEYVAGEGVRRVVSFEVTNDLTRCSQVEWISDRRSGRSRRVTQLIVDEVFSGVIEEAGGTIPVPRRRIGKENMVPECVADILISVAAGERSEEEFAFVVPFLQSGGRLILVQLLVRAGGQVPQQIGYDVADGHGAEIVLSGDETRAQHVYFNSRHELVWQRGAGGSPVWIAVTRDELINAFPDAISELGRWSQRFVTEVDGNAEW